MAKPSKTGPQNFMYADVKHPEIILLPPRLDQENISIWGDSMASSLFTGLSQSFLKLGFETAETSVFNFGIHSQNSIEVAMRHGGTKWSAHVDPGNRYGVIPASSDDTIVIGNFQDSILSHNLSKHSGLIQTNGWTWLPSDPLMYGYWPSVSSFKSTHVSIGGVEGFIWRDGPDWPYDTGQYLFRRKESGKSVPIVNPVDVHVTGAGYDWYPDNYVSSKDFSRTNTILWPFGPNVPQNPHELAADLERDSITSIVDSLQTIPGGSGAIILLYSAPIL